jgi:diketogulonate reductase-like aldo/keto reductase
MTIAHPRQEGQTIPAFLYGTAWKEDRTAGLVELALQAGFRGIDTANQRKHYHEAGAGEAIQAAIARGAASRGELFLQSKFTSRRGQDHRLPYDEHAPIAVQVEQSFASTLAHLGTDYLDSYLLHGPSQRVGLSADDWAAWRAMEQIHESGRAKHIGVSNVTREQLERLCGEARIQPRFVQNRCYASQGWDRAVREVCRQQSIAYQGFSLLTANRDVLASAEIGRLAKQFGRTPAQIVFRFAIDIGMIPLTGTSDPAHMRQDLAVLDFRLTAEEVERIERMSHG